MTWTSPMTFVDGTPLTAAQMNVYLRDNLLETAPAKASTQDSSGRYFVSNGANSIAERRIIRAGVSTSETTTSTSFVDLATLGPTNSSLATGIFALVILSGQVSNSTAGSTSRMGFEVTGASSIAASSNRALWLTAAATNQGMRATLIHGVNNLTAGSNTFQAKYQVSANTGTFADREMYVIPY